MEVLPFELEAGPSGRRWPIAGDVYLPAEGALAPVVAIAHDWLGHKGAPPVAEVARGLAAAGIIAVPFSFSGSGVPAGSDEVREDARFAGNSFEREIEDVERVVTAIFERMIPGRERFNIRAIGVVGMGTGGAVALLEAARDSRVRAVVTIAARASLRDIFDPGAFDAWATRGEAKVIHPGTSRPLSVGREMWRDLEARSPLDVLNAANALAIPCLVLHAAGDARVEEARAIYFSGQDAALELLEPGIEGAPRASAQAAARFLTEKLA